MKISNAAKEYYIEIEVRKFTPKTIRSYRNNLNLFLRFCEEQTDAEDMEDVTLAIVRQFTMYLTSKGKKASLLLFPPWSALDKRIGLRYNIVT